MVIVEILNKPSTLEMLGVYIEQSGEYQYFISRLSMIARVNVVLNRTVVVVDSD